MWLPRASYDARTYCASEMFQQVMRASVSVLMPQSPFTANLTCFVSRQGERCLCSRSGALSTLVSTPPSTSYAIPLARASRAGSRRGERVRVCAVETHSAEGSNDVLVDRLPRSHHLGVFDSQDTDLGRKDYQSFVHFFRAASSYITGHRGSTFVIVLPGQVCLMHSRSHSVRQRTSVAVGCVVSLLD